MAISPVDFSISPSFCPSFLSHSHVPSKISFFGFKIRGIVNQKLGFSSNSLLRIPNCTVKERSSSSAAIVGSRELEIESEDLRDECGDVDVIAIGSRKDAVLEFCFESPFQLSSLRFWSVLTEDASNMQLVQRIRRKDQSRRVVDVASFQQSCSKIIILVAGAGYGLDHTRVIDILKTIRSAKGFAVAVVMKPFSFEGQRRLDEVKDLVGKLKEYIDLFVGKQHVIYFVRIFMVVFLWLTKEYPFRQPNIPHKPYNRLVCKFHILATLFFSIYLVKHWS